MKPFNFIGYTQRKDGMFQKICEFPQGKCTRIEVIIRNEFGKLWKVVHGVEARKIKLASK